MCRDNGVATFAELRVRKLIEQRFVIFPDVSNLVVFFAATGKVMGNTENHGGREQRKQCFCQRAVEKKPEETVTIVL